MLFYYPPWMFFKTIFFFASTFFSAYGYMFEDDQDVIYTLVMEGTSRTYYDVIESDVWFIDPQMLVVINVVLQDDLCI
jgi:hypothetical protein